MAKRRASPAPSWPNLNIDVHDPRLHQVLALCATLFGLWLLGAVLSDARSGWNGALNALLRQGFGGFGAFIFALMLLVAGVWALRALIRNAFSVPWRRVVGAEVLFFAVLGLLHMAAGESRAASEIGGGWAGWTIGEGLSRAIGGVSAAILLGIVSVLGAIWAFNLDLAQTIAWLREQWANRTIEIEPEPQPKPERPKTPRPKPAPKPAQAEMKLAAESAKPAKRLRRDKRLPDLSLFRNQSKLDIDRALMQDRARIIEETLDGFGIPVKVTEMQQGPTVTQFGLQPGYVERRLPDGQTKRVKVKVSRITSLTNDLALALSASPIRIEAPVPGKPVVGVEVPNQASSMVAIRSVLDHDGYRRWDKPLKIALGQDVAGTPIYADLATMPHLLIAGATGSGKSVCINAVIASLLCTNTPEELRFLMIDPKMVELVQYNGIPHLLHPVVTDLDKASGALQWAMREMDKRYQLFKEMGVRNLDGYNKHAKTSNFETLPFVIVVIDELADLMMTAPEDIERTICRLAQMARATGIHLIIATQRPSVDVVTGLIKANFPARIAFAVTSQADSRVILDSGGAEKLLGRGDMLYMAPDSPKLLRLQGCYVSDEELKSLVHHWRDIAVEEQLDAAPIELPSPEAEASKDKGDALLDEAIKLVQQFDRASTSFLQRRMGIGYNRAAKLIDMMEARGIIGPAKDGGMARDVLIKAEATPEELAEE